MTSLLQSPGIEGLLSLSRREGVDIRPTLLRVLTDLYVQAPGHTAEEEQQYVELATRLIDEVDEATRAAVSARLALYGATPRSLVRKLGLAQTRAVVAAPDPQPAFATDAPKLSPERENTPEQDVTTQSPDESANPQPDSTLFGRPLSAGRSRGLVMEPEEAAELHTMFMAAGPNERIAILRRLEAAPLRPAVRLETRRIAEALPVLDQMAREADMIGFTRELAHLLILPMRLAEKLVQDEGGEPLALAARTLGMPTDMYERVLLFLDPELGASVNRVYRLSRLYETLGEQVALVMLSAWRGTNAAALRTVRHQSLLHDDDRSTARTTAGAERPAPQFGQRARVPGRSGTAN